LVKLLENDGIVNVTLFADDVKVYLKKMLAPTMQQLQHDNAGYEQ